MYMKMNYVVCINFKSKDMRVSVGKRKTAQKDMNVKLIYPDVALFKIEYYLIGSVY